VGAADGRHHDRDRERRSRPIVAFVAWGAVAGRSAELADAFGGESRCYYPPGGRRPPVLLRYLLASVRTVAYLVRRRPANVVVTSPPVPGALVTFLAARSVGARVLLDSHPGSFGAQGDRHSGQLQWLQRFLTRRVTASLVAAPAWAEKVEAWGGRAVVVHEAPGRWTAAAHERHARLRALYVGRFAGDEPWREVLAAAAQLPDVDLFVTGQLEDCPEEDRATAAANVTFVGFLGPSDYRRAVDEADVVVTLTTEPSSVMRAAYEAVYAGRPLVVSDWPIARELFPTAVHVANRAADIAAGIGSVATHYAELAGQADDARRRQLDRWDDQRRQLRALFD
jgi:glycosyltransferase involved in cell wall biosynthesis